MSRLEDMMRRQLEQAERASAGAREAQRVERARALAARFPAFVPRSAGHAETKFDLTVHSINETPNRLRDLARRFARRPPVECDVTDFTDTPAKVAAAERLKSLLDGFGSDKARAHNYHHLYGAVLAETDRIGRVVEIGLGTNNMDVVSHMGASGRPGASLRAFRKFLPHAEIVGADIDRRILFQEDRIATVFVDQTEPASFDALDAAIKGGCDLFIDDGLHAPAPNLTVLLFALDRLAPGGWLAIEDVAPEARPIWETAASLLPPDYATYIVTTAGRALMIAVQAPTIDMVPLLNTMRDNVNSDGACI